MDAAEVADLKVPARFNTHTSSAVSLKDRFKQQSLTMIGNNTHTQSSLLNTKSTLSNGSLVERTAPINEINAANGNSVLSKRNAIMA